MAHSDQTHWDERYRNTRYKSDQLGLATPGLPEHFEPYADLLVSATDALEIACGPGRFAVWLARQGVHTIGYDISPVAVAQANILAASNGVGDSCSFVVVDLDDGVPTGEQVDLIVCNMFRDARLDAPLIARLRPGGLLAVAALSEVGAGPGRFRSPAGELVNAFNGFHGLNIIASAEGDGLTWLLGRTHVGVSTSSQPAPAKFVNQFRA